MNIKGVIFGSIFSVISFPTNAEDFFTSVIIPAEVICRDALNFDKSGWDGSVEFSGKVREAAQRGLTVNNCKLLIDENTQVQKIDRSEEPSSSAEKLDGLADDMICRAALTSDGLEWDLRGFAQQIQEAWRRGLSIEKCQQLTGRIPQDSDSDQNNLVGIKDETICRDALNSRADDWDTGYSFRRKVDEAKRRGFTVNRCALLARILYNGNQIDSSNTYLQATTSDLLMNQLSGRPDKVLSPSDLVIQTHKWDGKTVETSLNCIFADNNDFRCVDLIAFSNIRIDFQSFDTEGQKYLEDKCDTRTKSNSLACRITIRFLYNSFSELEVGGLTGKLTTIRPQDGVGRIVRHGR